MFKLYTQERSIFGFADYGALLTEVRRVGARSALEFGPGASTLALIEGGCESILSFEHDARWLASAREQLAAFPHVRVERYENLPELRPLGAEFDLAFVDSPNGEEKRRIRHPGQADCARFNTVLAALQAAPLVLLHDARRPGEQATLRRVEAAGCRVSMIDTPKGIARIERPW